MKFTGNRTAEGTHECFAYDGRRFLSRDTPLLRRWRRFLWWRRWRFLGGLEVLLRELHHFGGRTGRCGVAHLPDDGLDREAAVGVGIREFLDSEGAKELVTRLNHIPFHGAFKRLLRLRLVNCKAKRDISGLDEVALVSFQRHGCGNDFAVDADGVFAREVHQRHRQIDDAHCEVLVSD